MVLINLITLIVELVLPIVTETIIVYEPHNIETFMREYSEIQNYKPKTVLV